MSRPLSAGAACRAETIERLLEYDSLARSASSRRDDLRSQVKDLSRQVADARRSGDDVRRAESLTSESRELGELERAADAEATAAGDEVRAILLELPNLPSPGRARR